MHAIGEVSYRDRIGIGVIVLLQDIEIFRNDKSRAAGTARKENNSLSGRGERFSVSATDAEILPFGKARTTSHVVEAVRYRNLEAPRQGGIPFPLAEIIGCRAKHVRHIAPDIGTAVTGKIDGIVDEVRRHELSLAHGAGP